MEGFRRVIEEEGVTVMPGLLSATLVGEAKQWLAGVESLGNAIPASYQPEFEPSEPGARVPPRKLRRLLWNDRPFWQDFLRRSGLDDLARSLVRAPVMIFHAAFLKPRRIGSHVGFHQDQALWDRPHPGAVTIWVALEDSTAENGALEGFPGSHERGEIQHVECERHPWHPVIDVDSAGLGEPRLLAVEAGGSVAWHPYFVHGSGPNRSEHDRRGMVMVFASEADGPVIEPDRYRIR